MIGALIAGLILSLQVAQPDTAIYGSLVARGPGFLIVADRPGYVIPLACPPSWCMNGSKALRAGMPVWIDTVGFNTETVTYCPNEDDC